MDSVDGCGVAAEVDGTAGGIEGTGDGTGPLASCLGAAPVGPWHAAATITKPRSNANRRVPINGRELGIISPRARRPDSHRRPAGVSRRRDSGVMARDARLGRIADLLLLVGPGP